MNATPRLLGGRYEIGDVLGRGGMAEVHIGRDTRLGRIVAIKMLRSDLARDPSFQARFRREAQSAAALNHPAVVAVYDSGEEPAVDGHAPVPYIVMEYVEGRTLRELVSAGQTMPWQEALRVTANVLAALAYSHRANIVHRDIKPANVMVTPTGDVKVMDFGIARALADSSATMTQTQAVIGTAQYLSPEQARGETVDARSDLYSAGCMLFELLAGRPPFVADSPVAVAYQHVGEQAVAPSTYAPGIPQAVDAIVAHALVKDRTARYQTADEFREDVEAALAGRRISNAALGTAADLGILGAGAAAGFGAPTEAIGAVSAAGTAVLQPTPAPEESMLPQGHRDPDQGANRTGLWILLGLLAVTVVAVGAFVLPGLLGGNAEKNIVAQVPVPVVAGKSVQEATDLIIAKKLTVATGQETAASEEFDKGLVIRTDPAAGQLLDVGKPVTLVISTGPDSVVVPTLAGKTLSEAEAALKEVGLRLGSTKTVDAAGQDKGRVVASTPAAGEPASKDQKIDLEIASGKVEVPNVATLELNQAITELTSRRLKVDAKGYQETDSQPDGTVISQSIPSGKLVAPGTVIKLVIARELSTPSTPTTSPTDGEGDGTETSPPATP